MNFIRQFLPIKWYAGIMTAIVSWFLWNTLTGRRIWGDDNASREVRTAGNRMYHK
jgi:hypothetical protein